MRQKHESEKLVPDLLQSIDPREIADSSLRQTIEILLNLIEELNAKVKRLEEENQKLEDENNRLKGEKGKPDIKANKTSRFKKDHSSEKERKISSKHSKSSKNANIQIDREKILEYPQSELPPDAEFKGYEDVIVQDILLQTDNVLFRKQKFYSASVGKTYLAPLPAGYDGEFGPGVKALVISLYYGGNKTQGKLLEFLEDIGISMSAGYLSNLLIKSAVDFESEFNEVYISGLDSSTWQHLDQTSARVKGINHTTNVVCNPLYTVYSTTLNKDRLSVLLLVLEYPELPLHNNPAELAARTMVQRRNISYATQTREGTKAWDIFMSLVATTRKLGVSFFKYMQSRISKNCEIPSLGTIIRDKYFVMLQPESWLEELFFMSG